MKITGGQKGKSFNDRELAGEVRTLTLNEIKKALTGVDEDFKKQVILKLAGSILPRLNELTGENGGAIKIEGVEINVRK
jgi:hypothetical protein